MAAGIGAIFMNRQSKIITSLTFALLLVTQSGPPAQAFRTPIAAVAGAKRLQQGMPDGRDDISFSPILLELAKLIGRTGLPAGFFLQNDSAFPEDAGLDLRTLLLYQAGLIKMPIRLQTGHKVTPSTNAVPSLAVPPIPEHIQELSAAQPSDLPNLESMPLPRDPEGHQVVPQKASVGEPARISIAMSKAPSAPSAAPMLSFDYARLHTDLGKDAVESSDSRELNADIPRLAMAMPRTNAMPFITNNAFRLWTYHPDAPEITPRSSESAGGTTFNGTFVVASIGVIKSITGRHITLAPGRLLASNHGGELLFQTGLAEVSVPPETTAVIEVIAQGQSHTIKIYALESRDSHDVVISLAGSKEKPLKLATGELLIVGDHQLTEAELAGNHASKDKRTANVAKGTFSVGQFLDKEMMLKSDRMTKMNERYVTLSTLKHKLTEPH